MSDDDYERAISQLSEQLNLSDQALSIAEGWSILPEKAQNHVVMLIDEYIANEIPTLKALYENRSFRDQQRFNSIVERVQDRRRGIPPESA